LGGAKVLVLPSGQIIDISTDRAKYHALRSPGVEPSAKHRALYALVDVIFRYKDSGGLPKRGWTEFDYVYSGYTVESFRHSADWSQADRDALAKWVREEDQYRRIEMTRRRLLDNQQRLSVKLNSSPRYLYSLLAKRLHNLSLQRASVEQWRATINNMKQSGVREEEIQWSGLSYFFAKQSATDVLSKQQVMSVISFKNIQCELSSEQIWGKDGGLCFKETAKRMPHQAVYRAALKLDESCTCVLRYVDTCYNYRVGVIKTTLYGHAMTLNKYWFALDPYGRAITNGEEPALPGMLYYDSSGAAIAAANRDARKSLGMHSGASFHTHYDHLTLFGGTDYREWIVSLPDFQRTFFGAHFFDHNVLAHIRTTVREDVAGRKLLFVEEIQSDWHQSGKRYGYDCNAWGQVANAPFKKDWPVLAIKLMLIYAVQNGFDGISWPKGEIQETRYSKDLNAIKRHYDVEIPKAINRLGRPFHSQTTTTWIETRDPWLNLEKNSGKWRVADGQGKFKTRARYKSRDEAMSVLARHCRTIDLEVPVIYVNDEMRQYIDDTGLPLFGETLS
jgi:hypothetical protein